MLTYTRTLTDKEETILLDILLDIPKWIDAAIDGKVNSCLSRSAKDYRATLIAAGAKSLPTSEQEIFDLKVANPEYMNRAEREAVVAENA